MISASANQKSSEGNQRSPKGQGDGLVGKAIASNAQGPEFGSITNINTGEEVQACNPSSGEMGSRHRGISGKSLDLSQAYVVKLQAHERPTISSRKVGST